MGAEACQQVEKDDNNEVTTRDKARNCLQICYNKNGQIENKEGAQVKPIQFSDEGQKQNSPSKSSQEHAKSTVFNYNEAISNPHLKLSQKQTNQFYKQNTQSHIKPSINSLNVDNIQPVIISKSSSGNLQYLNQIQNYEPISVPYSVIKLILQPEILKQIKKFDRDFHTEHGNNQAQTFRTWKLLKNGSYINKVSDGTTIIIKENQYFRGGVSFNTFIPEDQGLLVTLLGTYKGYFKKGLAHGAGTFTSIDGKKIFDGSWKSGQLQKGKVNTQNYRYDGSLKNCKPNGRGNLVILKTKTQYIGCFKDGLFDDHAAIYKCNKYIYKGDFVEGKKHGNGTLTPNANLTSGSKIKQQSIKKLQGVWQKDRYIGPAPRRQ